MYMHVYNACTHKLSILIKQNCAVTTKGPPKRINVFCCMSYLGSWQEQQDMDLAIAMSTQQSSQHNCLLIDCITDVVQQQQHQWVSVSTIYGTLIRGPVHPCMPILDFKAQFMKAYLWDGFPIGLCIPLAIGVDLAGMMPEGRGSVTNPNPWRTDGRYNRFRLCTMHNHLLDDDGVLLPNVLTDCTLSKAQWVKQVSFRFQGIEKLHAFAKHATY